MPSCVTPPVPLTVPAKVWSSLRLKAKVARLATLPLNWPEVPPSPTLKVPPTNQVPPVCVRLPVSSVVPAAALTSTPEPDTLMPVL